MNTRVFRPACALILALMVLAAGASASEKVHLRFARWNHDQAFVDAAAAFNAMQDRIEVEVVIVPDYPTRLRLELASGIGPDLFVVHPWWTPVGLWGPEGTMVDLTPYWERDAAELSPHNWFPPALASGQANGRLYALFYGVSVYGHLDYNIDLLEAAGLPLPADTWETMTWNDLAEMAVKLTRDTSGDGEPDQWGLQTGFNDWRSLSTLLLSTGNPIYRDNDLTFDVATDGSYRAMEWIVDLTRRNVMGGNWEQGTAAMRTGQGWVHFAEPLALGGLRIERPATAIMPADPVTGNRLFRGGGLGLAINSESPYRDAAWEFIKYFVSTEGWAKAGIEGRGFLTHIPGHRDLVGRFLDIDPEKFPATVDPTLAIRMMDFSEPLTNSTNPHLNTHIGNIESYLTNEWRKVFRGEQPPVAFVETVTQQVNRILREGQ